MNHDYWLTEELRRLTYTLVDFIQNGYNVKVKKLVCKFIMNENEEIIFTGAKELIIDFNSQQNFTGKELSIKQFQNILEGKFLRRKPRTKNIRKK